MRELPKRRLISLLEIMRQFNVWQLVLATSLVAEVESEAKTACKGGDRDTPISEERIKNFVAPMVSYCKTHCEGIGLGAAVNRIDTPDFRLGLQSGMTFDQLRMQLQVLLEAIQSELPYRRFAFVPVEKAKIYDNRGKDWGSVWGRFPEAKEDTERAIDCYALEQDTACVFHLMRVAEMGLRALAKELRVSITHKGCACPLEYGDWDKVITAIKNKIDAARRLAAGPRRQRQLEFYSDAADHCTFMKDIWRNDISHARKPYSDTDSLAVLGRVREFMQFLERSLSASRYP